MKPAKKIEEALAVRIIDEPSMMFPAFTLKQASKNTIKFRNAVLEDGGENISGAMVYHPVKGLVAWVSPNGRVWEMTNESDLYKGGKKEITGSLLTNHFTQVFA